MTTKEYLQQIYIIHKKITRLEERRQQIRAEMYGTRSPAGQMGDRVQTSMSGDAMLNLIAKVDRIERDIVYEKDALLDAQSRIIRQIESVPDEKQKDVLFKRYVCFKRWEQIAVDMNLTVRYVYMLHGDALKSFSKIIG